VFLHSTGFGNRIAVGQPERQAFFEAAQHGLLLGACCGVVHDHGIGIMTVAGFDHLVRTNQIQRIGGEAVIFHERVALDDGFDLFGSLGLGWVGDFGAILDAAFDEDRAAAPMTQSRLFETRSSQAR